MDRIYAISSCLSAIFFGARKIMREAVKMEKENQETLARIEADVKEIRRKINYLDAGL